MSNRQIHKILRFVPPGDQIDSQGDFFSRLAVENARESIMVTTAELNPPGPRILFVNPAFTQMTGYTQEEIIGKTPRILQGPKTDRHVLDELRSKISKGESFEGRAINYRKDGSEFYIEWYVQPVFNAAGQISHYFSVQRDITERLEAEKDLRNAEEKYRNIFENAMEGIFQITPEGKFISANPALARIFGYESSDELVQSLLDVGSQLYLEPSRRSEFIDLLHKEGSVSGFESQIRRKDGSVIWISENARAVKSAHEKILFYEGMVQDITERKSASEQATLLEKARDAILVLNLDNTIRFWNTGATNLYGWSTGETLNQKADELLQWEDAENSFSTARTTVLDTGEWSGELKHVTKQGKKVIVESRWSLVKNDGGQPKTILVINTDITEKKKLEKQFLQSQRMESIGLLAGGIAHDLNNVLAPILMGSSYLKNRLPDDESRHFIATLEASAQRGADLVKQVIAFARGIEGDMGNVQMRHIVVEIANMATQTFAKSIQIRRNVQKDLWCVRGDTTQLHQILLNLCVNARDAMPRGGIITITGENIELIQNLERPLVTVKPGKYVLLQVSDTGTGIPDKVIARIFDPFFTTKEEGKGTGLGLSTVQAIVKAHGGVIDVLSQVGQGTTFRVYLPALLEDEEPPVVIDPLTNAPIITGNGKSILVVDDEPAILEITKETLQTYGYKVITADCGKDAVTSFTGMKDTINVVLVDMMMPRMDGAATIKALKKIDPNIKIICVSGLSHEENSPIALGVKAYLQKPYSLGNLLKTLQSVLSE